MCTDIAIINEGKIIKEGSLNEILTVNYRFKLKARCINPSLLNSLKAHIKLLKLKLIITFSKNKEMAKKKSFLNFF